MHCVFSMTRMPRPLPSLAHKLLQQHRVGIIRRSHIFAKTMVTEARSRDSIDHIRHTVAVEKFNNFSNEFLKKVNDELQATRKCLLQSFMRPEAVSQTVTEARKVVKKSYRSENTHNVYLEEPSHELPTDHPRNLEEATGQKELYRTGDPVGDLNIHVYNDGDELGWHMDRGEFAVTIHLQEPVGGGIFEYVENVRSPFNPGYDTVGAILATGSGEERARLGVKCIPQNPGDLLLFRGHQAMHRVTPIQGNVPRMLSVLSFDLAPNKMLNEYTRMKFYGR